MPRTIHLTRHYALIQNIKSHQIFFKKNFSIFSKCYPYLITLIRLMVQSATLQVQSSSRVQLPSYKRQKNFIVQKKVFFDFLYHLFPRVAASVGKPVCVLCLTKKRNFYFFFERRQPKIVLPACFFLSFWALFCLILKSKPIFLF